MVGAMPVNLIPKFCNGAMDSHNGGEDCESKVFVGSRIKCNDDFGTVKYIGEVQGYKGIWYGVEWDNAERGKHDGCVDDVQYFKTTKPGAGSFIRPNKIAPLRTCAEAIRRYYGDREDETVAAHRRTVINEWKREMGAPFIEMVGFEKIHQKQKFDRLLEVCVHDQCVARAGDVAALCPNVRSLDASQNLFSSWREVIQLSAQLPDLRELDLSKNRMEIDVPEEAAAQLAGAFGALEKLNLSWCEYSWAHVAALARLWPRVAELVAAHNRIAAVGPPPEALRSLVALRLDGNPLRRWADAAALGRLPRLRTLSLNDCLLEEIRFEGDPDDGKVDAFESLEVLFLNRNRIDDWRSVGELNRLKSLKKLYFLKNPIQRTEDYDTGSQLIIAKIGTLQELNGSAVTGELRRGAEYDYLKRYGAEWRADDPAFRLQHPRFRELLDRHGVPEDSLLARAPRPATLTAQLLELTLRDERGRAFTRKFPAGMAVQKLLTLARRLFAPAPAGVRLLLLDRARGAPLPLDNAMKDLAYYSVRAGDTVLVRPR